MSTNNVVTKTIKFKASAEGFEQVYKNIQKIAQNSGLQLPESMLNTLKQYENMITNVFKLINKGDNATEAEVKEIDRMLRTLNTSMAPLLDKFASLKLPSELLGSFLSVNKEIKEAQKRLAALNAQAAKYRGWVGENESGQPALTDKGYKEAFRQGFDAKTKRKLLTVGSTNFSDFGDLSAKAAEFEALDPNSLNDFQRAVIAARNEIRKLIDEMRLDDGDTFIDKFNKDIERSRNLVEAQLQEVNKLSNKVHNTNVSPSSNQERVFELKEMQDLYNQYYDASNEYARIKIQEANTIEKTKNIEVAHTQTLEKKNKTLAGTVASAYAYHAALNFVKRAIQQAIQVVTSMDQALTGMAVVTTMSREETWQLVGSFQSLAKETGKTTTEIANMATKFYQQGKNTKEVLELTEAAAKAATIAGIDGSQSIDLLTNAMNGFQLASTQAMEVSDKFAALAAASATDYEELATALSKVAAQANLAGMSMDFTLGMLARGIEVTREAPETIGTALKTVISRMRELTDYGKTLEDNMDVNRVAAALSNVGIALMDTNGQFRDMEEVFTEVGQQWDTLNKNQQANIAIAMAGTRQQSRFIAMMQDFDRTLELVNISSTSYGATLAQQAKYMEGMEAKLTLMKNAWEELLLSYVNSDMVIGILEIITGGIEALSNNMWSIYGITGLMLVLGAKKIIQNQIIKQQEFEINKERNQLLIEQKKAELEALKIKNKSINEEKLKKALEQHNAKLDIARKKEAAALQARMDAEEAARNKKLELQKQEAHIEELERIKAEAIAQIDADVAARKIRKSEANKAKGTIQTQYGTIINEEKRKLESLQGEYNTLLEEQTEATNNYNAAQRETIEAQRELEEETDKVSRALNEEAAAEERVLELDLKKLKIERSSYTFSLRNLLHLSKMIIAKIASKKAIEAETKALKQNTEATNENAAANVKNATSEVTEESTRKAGEGFDILSQSADAATDSLKKGEQAAVSSKKSWKSFVSTGLIALGATIAIGGAIAAINWGVEKVDQYKNYIQNTTEALEQLQVELYNTSQEHQTIKKLGDEFESLSRKINHSAEDAQKLNDIVEEINSTEGREVIDVNADRAAQLAQIRGLERSKRLEKENIAKQMRNTISEGYTNAAFGRSRAIQSGGLSGFMAGAGVAAGGGAVLGGAALAASAKGLTLAAMGGAIPVIGQVMLAAGAVAAIAGLIVAGITKANEEENKQRMKEYREFITTSQVGQQTLRTIAQNNVKALEDFSSSQSRELEGLFIAMVADESSRTLTLEGGLQTEVFENMIEANEAHLQDFYNAESFSNMYDAIEQLDDTLIKYAIKSGSTLGSLAMAGSDAAKAMDNLGLSVSDYMNLLNNVKSVMLEFEMSEAVQKEIMAEIPKILASSVSESSKMLQLQSMVGNRFAVSDQQYQEALAKKIALESQKIEIDGRTDRTYAELQAEVKDLETRGKTSGGKYKDLSAALDKANTELEAYTAIIDAYENQDKIKADLMASIGDLIFPVESANNFADALTNITSASERLTKAVTDLGTMALKDKLELLGDYPELATDILEDNLDAATISEALVEKYNKQLKAFNRSENNLGAHLEAMRSIFNSSLTIGDTVIDPSKLTGLNDISYQEAQKILTSGITAQDIVKAWGKDITDEVALAQANSILGNAQQILELGITKKDLGTSYEDYLAKANKAERDAFFNRREALTAEIDLLENRLELLSETEEAEALENEILTKKIQILSEIDQSSLGMEGLEKKLREAFGDDKLFDEILSKGVIKITENGLERNVENVDTLSKEAREVLESFFSMANTVVEAHSEDMQQYYSELKEVQNDIIDSLEKETDKENELLEKRKEAYEEYFDEIDALEEEQERNQNKESLIKQIAALSGGIDGASKNKIKDLQSQLNDLLEEEAEAQKEEARQAVLDDIDSQIEANNQALKDNTAALSLLTAASIAGEDDITKYFNMETNSMNWEAIQNKYGYSNGGYVSHTGLAYVHGTPDRPEAFLSAEDTENIRQFLDTFDVMLKSSSVISESESVIENNNNNSSISIENINIQTNNLNNTQDFRNAGNALAKEFAKAIRDRGINVNVKK